MCFFALLSAFICPKASIPGHIWLVILLPQAYVRLFYFHLVLNTVLVATVPKGPYAPFHNALVLHLPHLQNTLCPIPEACTTSHHEQICTNAT